MSTNDINFTYWKKLLSQKKELALVKLLMEAPVVDVAEFLDQESLQTLLALLSIMQGAKRSSVFSYLNEKKKLKIYNSIPKKAVADIFAFMASHERVDFFQKLSHDEQIKLLPYLKKNVREDVITLSSYSTDSAGGIMSTDFATAFSDMSVKEALQRLREDAPSKKMMYYIYILNEELQMIGIVSLKDLIMANEKEKVSNILFENFVYATINEDRESVASKISKYDLAAIPVLNEEKQMLGIVRYDEAIDVIKAEQTEDMEKFMGIVTDSDSSERQYLETTSFQHYKKRISWVIGLFILSFLSGAVIDKYESVLAKFTILATYITSITDAGGNAGSQAASVVIRALSLNQINLRDWLRVVFKEAKISIMLASTLFGLAFLKVISLSLFKKIYYNKSLSLYNHSLFKIGFAISLALSLQVIVSTIIGAILPIIAKLFKGDPAVAASPAITTIVDLTGMIIYFFITTSFLI